MEILKILIICLITAVLCIILKQYKAEYAFMLGAIASLGLLCLILKNVYSPIQDIFDKIKDYGVEISTFKVAFKAMGIGFLTTQVADICRENGQLSLANVVIFTGKTAIFLLSVPLAVSILELAIGFIK